MALEDDIRYFAANPTLNALDEDALRHLALRAETRILLKGDVLFRRDEPSDGGYVLISGSLALEANDATGQNQIVRPPVLLGEMALITRTKRPATAVACEPSKALKISRQLFQATLSDSPRSAERLRRMLSVRLIDFLHELDGVAKDAPFLEER